jgi:hypothetical protein
MEPMRQQPKEPLGPALAVVLTLVTVGILILTQGLWADNLRPTKPSDSSKSGQPPIVWTPTKVEMDGDDTVSVTLTAQSAIPATELEFVPGISPYLSVYPQTLPALAKGATQMIQIAANVPAGTPMDTIDGTLHVRAGSSTIARPLPINLETWKSASGEGMDFKVPPGWVMTPGTLEQTNTVEINNFASAYGHGGIVPPSGAVINSFFVTCPACNLDSVIALDTEDDQVLDRSVIMVSGQTGTRVSFTQSFGALSYYRANVYVQYNQELYRFLLTYQLNDPMGPEFISEFSQFLNTVVFSGDNH